MPLYDFCCPRCMVVVERLVRSSTVVAMWCPTCRPIQAMTRLPSAPAQINMGKKFDPYNHDFIFSDIQGNGF